MLIIECMGADPWGVRFNQRANQYNRANSKKLVKRLQSQLQYCDPTDGLLSEEQPKNLVRYIQQKSAFKNKYAPDAQVAATSNTQITNNEGK